MQRRRGATGVGEAMANMMRFQPKKRKPSPKPLEVYYIARDQNRPHRRPPPPPNFDDPQ